MKKNKYLALFEGGEGVIVEKKSRFIATIEPVETVEEAEQFIEKMKKKYWDARHNCHAFTVGTDMPLSRCSDDGEPSGTAGKPMLEVNGKKGKMLVCQDRECGHRKNVSRITNARCPQCKKKLELRGEGDGQIFACKCGYREKLSAFEARRKKESRGKVDKRTVQKYLKQQEKEAEPLNNPFADLLKGMKFD